MATTADIHDDWADGVRGTGWDDQIVGADGRGRRPPSASEGDGRYTPDLAGAAYGAKVIRVWNDPRPLTTFDVVAPVPAADTARPLLFVADAAGRQCWCYRLPSGYMYVGTAGTVAGVGDGTPTGNTPVLGEHWRVGWDAALNGGRGAVYFESGASRNTFGRRVWVAPPAGFDHTTARPGLAIVANRADAGSYAFGVVNGGGGNGARADDVPPTARANGPYAAVAGEPLRLSSAGSADPEGSSLAYRWEFPDGQTSTEANPAVTFAAPLRGPVTLTVTSTRGSSATATAELVVRVRIVARVMRRGRPVPESVPTLYSSDETVATVDAEGVVHEVGSGTCFIYGVYPDARRGVAVVTVDAERVEERADRPRTDDQIHDTPEQRPARRPERERENYSSRL